MKQFYLIWLVNAPVNSSIGLSRDQHNMASTIERGAPTNASGSNMSLKKALSAASPLSLRIVAECPVTKARACDLILPHAAVSTPVFMPVGTQGTLKGITVDQLEGLGCQICLGNTYHLGMRPVKYLLLLLTLFHSGLCRVKIKEETRLIIINRDRIWSKKPVVYMGSWTGRKIFWLWVHIGYYYYWQYSYPAMCLGV